MKKFFAVSVLLTLSVTTANAQQITVFGSSGPGGTSTGTFRMASAPDLKKIDDATLECTYDFEYLTDTLNTEKKKDDLMVLQIGKNLSKFYSYRTLQADSLMREVTSPEALIANPERFKGGERFEVYKNHPAGKITYTDKIGRDHFLYEEETPDFAWTILDETREIGGYNCQRAECTFRGRKWYAWFTQEIPVSDGPWKLGGLPGLILSAGDTQGHYTFTFSGIRQVAERSINMADVQYHKINRKNYLKTQEKFHIDPIGYMSTNANVNVKVMTSSGEPDAEMMKPKPMKYDFMETDYKK